MITPSGDPGLIPLQVASLALAIIPWIVIDSREPKLLYTSASIPLILTFCFRPLNSLIDLNKQEHPFQQEVLAHFTLVASILVVIICLQALVRKSRSIEKKMVEAKESTVESLNKLKESQAMLIQKEKLASIGILTSGLAHEVNNPLNYIQSGVYGLENLMQDQANDGGQSQYYTILDLMKTGVNRVESVVGKLELYGNALVEYERNEVDIREEVKTCISKFEKIYPHVNFDTLFSSKRSLISAKSNKISQIFHSLIENAVHAVELKADPLIAVSYRVENENSCIVIIRDNGSGIPEKEISKIFDPFFTTKAPGRGLGLGLSTVNSFVNQLSGSISITSEQNKGTLVQVQLPIKTQI